MVSFFMIYIVSDKSTVKMLQEVEKLSAVSYQLSAANSCEFCVRRILHIIKMMRKAANLVIG